MQPKAGLPIGLHENGKVKITISDYNGKSNILHINDVAMMNDDVYVSYSKIKDARWGLFANRQLINGNIILEYRGNLLRKNRVEEGHKDYIAIFSKKTQTEQLKAGYLSPNYAIDAFPYVDEKVEPLKRIGGFSIFSVDKPNVFIRESNDRIGWSVHDIEFYRLFMYAQTNIRKDDEIIWNYCGHYIDIPMED